MNITVRFRVRVRSREINDRQHMPRTVPSPSFSLLLLLLLLTPYSLQHIFSLLPSSVEQRGVPALIVMIGS